MMNRVNTPWTTRGSYDHALGLPTAEHVTVRPGDPIVPNDAFVMNTGGHELEGVQGEVGEGGSVIGSYLVYTGEKLGEIGSWRYVPAPPLINDGTQPLYTKVLNR